ncbi:YjjG family noncanonical pyrimidine nucleotidase [Paradesertivirga mongoliensis]|uniref:YjjG family noncanonical pyrimidine nucleotidase n=1 Tax=Paradesertivirga mongoliensis TaxID=2100740 RepID=A0ABW4ZJL6_9SPHI|nr:YjjG family noncanonical pyrimidine nucleotidase [Pedobacter mongoliensis]
MLRHIFFDLDHTIWDFDKNAEETLHELYHQYSLESLGLSCPVTFIETYTRNNHLLWADYHTGKISKEHLRTTRFSTTFLELGLAAEDIPKKFEEDYVRICPTKTNLFPQAHETLSYLQEKYTLHLISNGFKESTELKIQVTGLAKYFENIVISEVVGINKPDKAIFEFALNAAKARKEESIMIGDSIEADIRGAIGFGMEAIYFNPLQKEVPADVARQINSLNELIEIL